MSRCLAAGVVLALFAGSGGCKSRREATPESLRKAGVVRIGFANEAPYAYRDTATGKLAGEAPQIARKVFARMGIGEVEGVLAEFGSLIPGLEAGRFDMIAAGMYVTPQRCGVIGFSEPTFCVGEAFLVREGNPLRLHSYEDVVANKAVKLGVVAGTVELGYAEQLGVPKERIVVFPDPPSALAGVRAGRVDAYAGTSLTVQDLLNKTDAAVERAAPFTDPVIDGAPARGCGAFGFRKRDTALLREFNRHLAEIIGTEEHAALVAPFGFVLRDITELPSAAALCGE